MSTDVGYTFDRVQLKRGAYSPIAHGDLELEQATFRKAAIKVLTSATPLKMELVSVPVNAEVAAQNQETMRRLNVALEGGALQIRPAITKEIDP